MRERSGAEFSFQCSRCCDEAVSLVIGGFAWAGLVVFSDTGLDFNVFRTKCNDRVVQTFIASYTTLLNKINYITVLTLTLQMCIHDDHFAHFSTHLILICTCA